MPKYYPAFLNLDGKPCTVIGGGPIAERKVKGLVEAGARVTVVSPRVTPRIERRTERGQIKQVSREYQASDCQGVYLLIAATDDMPLNRSIGIEARKAGAIVNVVDDPDYCDFVAPSIVRRGDITFAISTAGASPALARWLRRQIETQFPSEYGGLATVLAQVRKQLRQEGHKISPSRWQRSIDSKLLDLIKGRKRKEAKLRLLSFLRNGSSESG